MTTGLKEAILDFFPLGIPWRGLGRAPMPGRWWGLAAIGKKSVLQSSPHGRTGIFFLGRIPTLARAPMPGRWRGWGGFFAGQVARQECEHK